MCNIKIVFYLYIIPFGGKEQNYSFFTEDMSLLRRLLFSLFERR